MIQWIEVIGAYGRDYQNQASVRKDWDDHKDFQIVEPPEYAGRYINKPQANSDMRIIVRYHKLQRTMRVMHYPEVMENGTD